MITDKDVMYIYSEVINQMEPQKILDVGMFYKAIGAVSRRILEMEVPEDCLQFTTPSGLHSVLERPFSEANGRPFLVKRSPLIVC